MVASSFRQRRLYGDSASSFRPSRMQGKGLPDAFGASFGVVVRWISVPLLRLTRFLRRRPGEQWRVFIAKVAGIAAALFIGFCAFIWFTLPDISDPRSLLASQSTIILDRTGLELYRLHGEQDRTYVTGDRIPEHAKQAMIAIEDERFYERGCLDIISIARVVLRFGSAGGGSTITRQLARNALELKNDVLLVRKAKEFILGCQLEHRFTKDQLLEFYLNWIPFGQNAYGIEQASHTYFGIPASQLSLAKAATLAALPQRPSYFSPYRNHVRTSVAESVYKDIVDGRITLGSQIAGEDVVVGLLGANAGTGATTVYVGGRTDQVLANMEQQGFISEAQRLAALEELETITFQPSRETIRAPHFVLWVRDQVEKLLGPAEVGLLEQGGLKIETTLDWELQQGAEQVVAFHREDIENRFGALNMALLSVDRRTREILAYVGNMDYSDEEHGGKIDMVHVPRQPGSSFKPFVYAGVFQKGYSPATVLYDVPTKIGDDDPRNFDGKFWGLMTIRAALGASRNIPAAKAFFLAGGEDAILTLATNLGVPSPLERRQTLKTASGGAFDYGWPLALGAAETPLSEMVQGYSTFADGGTYRPIIGIRRIMDKKGNLLYQVEEEKRDALDPRIAYLITSILSDEAARPQEYWRTQLSVPGYQSAAKTGTSNKCLERNTETGDCKLLKPDNAWTIGYTPELVTGVWVGNADSSAMYDKGDGLNTASPIWRDYMIRAHRRIASPQTTFDVPSGIVQPQISTLSGQLPTECTPVAYRKADIFLEEHAPTLPDPDCAQLTVDRVTQLLASDACPEEAQEEGSFLVAHSLLGDRWPTWEEGVQKWVREQMVIWNASPTHSGSLLPLPVAPTEECDPALTPGRLVKPEVEILSPGPSGSTTYPVFRPQMRFDVGSSVREVRYEIDGKRVAIADAAPFDIPLRVPRSIEEGGSHTLTVTLIDEYYNQAMNTVSFRFEEDHTPPTIELLSPEDGDSFAAKSVLSIRAKAQDDNGAIKYVQFFLDGVLLTTKPSEPFEIDYTISAEPGIHMIRAVAEDMAKNTASAEVSITVR